MKPWTLKNSTLVMSAPPWVEVTRETVELPSGRIVDDFYRVVFQDYALVVPVTPAKEIVMIRGYKHGLGRISLSLPAGFIEKGESPLATGQRELREETGYAAAAWTPLGTFVTDGNRQGATAHVFLATGARPSVAPVKDDMEDVEVVLLKPEAFGDAVARGEIALFGAAGAVALALWRGLE